MLISLESVREKPFRWKETVGVDASVVDAPELVKLGPVSWQGEVSYAEPDYLLMASYAYDQVLSCVRCLAEVEDAVEGELQLLLTTEPPPSDAGEVALKEEELGLVFLEDEEIEIDDFLEEQVALGVPMKPQCRPDCQGLCSECGADLNEGPCGCETKTVDPRWQALAGIKAKLDENE